MTYLDCLGVNFMPLHCTFLFLLMYSPLNCHPTEMCPINQLSTPITGICLSSQPLTTTRLTKRSTQTLTYSYISKCINDVTLKEHHHPG